MSKATPEPPRANVATLLRYLHEERMASAAKRTGDLPAFSAKRSTASGSLGAWELTVSVPVCDEYPTAQAAYDAQVKYMRQLATAFPPPTANGGGK